MKELELIYPHGRMVLYVERFFPCKLYDARKIFPMIRKYAKDEDINDLRAYLQEYIKNIQTMKLTDYQKQVLIKRAKRNLEMLGGA